MSVLLVEHDMGFVMNLADRIVVLDFGTKIAEGTPADVQDQSRSDRGLSRSGGMSALLSVTDAACRLWRGRSVRSVSLEVGANQIVTVVGANGAGKTTLLSAIMGILPLKGRVAFAGQDLSRLDIEDRVAMGLGLVPEQRELFVDHDGRGQSACSGPSASAQQGENAAMERGLHAVSRA